MKIIGIPDEFVEQGTQAALRAKYGMDAKGITRQILSMFPGYKAGKSSVRKSKAKTVG